MTRSPPNPDVRAPDARDLTGLAGLKLGNYRLERLVGRGRMGAVYLANDEALLRPTAIKVLSWTVAEARGQDPVQWFLSEARLVARINHPRVVQIYGVARHGDRCYIAMEYVAGPSAEAAIAASGAMAPLAATDVLMQAAAALHAAHRSGVVHRDVKPANLLLGPGGVAKLGDFGMALGFGGVQAGTAHLRVGTPYYTAPEIWRGEAASAASDIYSLGATYHHLLTGRPPFAGQDVAAIEQAHLHTAPPDPHALVSGLPESCSALVRRALAKSPRDRHGSAQELLWDARRVLQDLNALGGGRTGASPLHSKAAPSQRRPGARAPPADPGVPEPLARAFGFARRPFADPDPDDTTDLGEPFAAAREAVLASVAPGAAAVTALVGDPGSGRAVLCRRVASELAAARPVWIVEARPNTPGGTLVQRICRVAGVVEGATDDENLDALVAGATDDRSAPGAVPLIVLASGAAAPAVIPALAKVVSAALWARSFQVLVAGAPGLVAALRSCGLEPGDQARELRLPPLDREQVARYVLHWISTARAPSAPPLIVSPDALRLLAWRSGGTLRRLDRLASDMLLRAAREGRRTLCSRDAWTASEEPGAEPREARPREPGAWPTPEAVKVIDSCRREAGLPPWPRTGARELS